MEKNKIGNIEAIEINGEIGVKSENSPFVSSFYFIDFYDDTAVKRFIKSTERLIRQSKEYKTYLEGLHTTIPALNYDNILSNITTGDVDIEFHHHPFTLYDLVEICMLQNMIDKKNFTTFSIAKQIMELHSKHYVGLVPLTKTMHELAHAGSLFISTKQIFGDYSEFIKKYSKAIPADRLNKVKEIERLTQEGMLADFKGLL